MTDNATTVLIVEDDQRLAALTADYLQQNGLQVTQHYSGSGAAERILLLRPDIVLLDIMLPGESGTAVCRAVREHFDGGIIMVTARDDDMDELLGLELGADDYIAKPVQPRLLLARIQALLRRLAPRVESDPVLSCAALTVEVRSRVARVAQAELELTDAEFDLLALLLAAQGTIVSRESLLRQTRGIDYDGIDRSIDNRIARLRRRLPGSGVCIKTVRNRGYLLVAESARS